MHLRSRRLRAWRNLTVCSTSCNPENLADNSVAGKHPETKRWVNATRALISRDDPGALEQADNHMLYDTMRMIMQDLEKAAPISWTENVQTALGKIIAATIELFRLLQSQNADFHIGFARVTNTEGHHRRYSPSWTEDIDNEMEGGGQNFVVGLSVFPGIFKCGDERGENVRSAQLSILCCSIY